MNRLEALKKIASLKAALPAASKEIDEIINVLSKPIWHDLNEKKPEYRKWVMFRFSGGGINPTALHYGAMSDDIWIVTRGDGTKRIEALYECYDKIEWLDFDELN